MPLSNPAKGKGRHCQSVFEGPLRGSPVAAEAFVRAEFVGETDKRQVRTRHQVEGGPNHVRNF